MKVTNTSIETHASSNAGGAGAVSGAGGNDSRAAAAQVSSSDSVNLSGASQLLNLAKASTTSDRSAKLASVAALVRSGQYSTDTTGVSRAVVEGHIQ